MHENAVTRHRSTAQVKTEAFGSSVEDSSAALFLSATLFTRKAQETEKLADAFSTRDTNETVAASRRTNEQLRKNRRQEPSAHASHACATSHPGLVSDGSVATVRRPLAGL